MHKEFKGWIEFLGIKEPILIEVNANEKSRKYYKIEKKSKKFVALDASSDKELVPRMIGIGLRLKETTVKTALIRSFELHKGFMLLSDVGSVNLLDKCSASHPSLYYEKAMDTLIALQEAPTLDLQPYDEALLIEEMNGALEWYIKGHLKQNLECMEGRNFLGALQFIAKEVLACPQGVLVHSDYHAKNLIVDENDEMVLMEYQDAKMGSMVYDLSVLLYDSYVSLDKKERRRLAYRFKEKKGIEVDDDTFMRWIECCALQINLKRLGSFAKASIEGKKEGYIEHTPLMVHYILEIASNYPQLDFLTQLLTPKEKDSIGFRFS